MFKNDYLGRRNATGNKIKDFRVKRGMSQRQLAEAAQVAGLDVDKYAIMHIESGKRVVPDFELTVYAQVLGVDRNDLFEQLNNIRL